MPHQQSPITPKQSAIRNEGEYLQIVNDMKIQYSEMKQAQKTKTRQLIGVIKDLQYAIKTLGREQDARFFARWISAKILKEEGILSSQTALEKMEAHLTKTLPWMCQSHFCTSLNVLEDMCSRSTLVAVAEAAMIGCDLPQEEVSIRKAIKLTAKISRYNVHSLLTSYRQSRSKLWRDQRIRDDDTPDPMNLDLRLYDSDPDADALDYAVSPRSDDEESLDMNHYTIHGNPGSPEELYSDEDLPTLY